MMRIIGRMHENNREHFENRIMAKKKKHNWPSPTHDQCPQFHVNGQS